MSKICGTCGSVLPLAKFYKDKKSSDGHSWECSACAQQRIREHSKTPRGRALNAWRLMNRRIAVQPEYAGIEVRMSRETFLKWAIPEYAAWIESGNPETPTIDRINPDGHYEIGNIRLLSWSENAIRNRRNVNVHAPDGHHWCSECKQYLPFASFGRSKNLTHGLATVCKACRIANTPHRHHPRWRNDIAPDGQRWCCKCVTLLSESDFYRCKVHGFQSACKKCQNSRHRQRLS